MNDVILVTPFKYTEKNYKNLVYTLINIINLDVNFDYWYILIGDSENLSIDEREKINDLNNILLHYDYNIYIEFCKEKHPAHLKYKLFTKIISEYGYDYKAFFLSIDADRVFTSYCFSNLVDSLRITTDKKFIVYSVVDYINYRNYDNYISEIVDITNFDSVVKNYGKEVLPYCKLEFLMHNNYIEIPIGGSGFAISLSALNYERLNLLKNFEEGVRGHDVLLASTFEKIYLLTDSWCLHLGADVYDEYWEKYDERLKELNKYKGD